MKIYQILDKIDDYQLFVPAFQREYVWKRENAKDLVDSLINDYPTGTMLTWETSNPPELKGMRKYDEKQGAIKLILDGQQRITTMYMLINGRIPPYYTEADIKSKIKDLHVNVETLELEYFKKSTMENNPLWVNITNLLQNQVRLRDVIDKLETNNNGDRLTRERENLIDDNFKKIERIKDREFVEQTVPVKATIKEAIDIFYIVNTGGVNLTDAELALAQISGYWPEARESIKKKISELEEVGWVFKLDFMIYVLLGVMHNSGSKMEKLHSPDNMPRIKEVWERLEKDTLDYVFNIMQSQAYIDHTKEINSVYALIPIIVFAFNKGKERMSHKEIKKAVKWFYYSQIRTRYISQLQQKLDKDLKIINSEKDPFDKLLSLIEADRKLEIHKDEFIGIGVSHPLWGLMRWYFKSREAICMTTGISIRKNMGKKYSLEWDHIFAYSVLKKEGYDWTLNRHKYSLAQEITNRVVLTQVGNRTKSDKLAENYLKEVKEKFPDALDLQAIPKDDELWKLDNFEQFLEARRILLTDQLNDYLNNITEMKSEEVDMDLSEIIAAGESSEVEFKTTLRYDMRENMVNKVLEGVIMKTLAAFSNAEGGMLIMGVNDDMEIIGLENDYNTLKEGDKDGFEIHLRNLINKNYGVDFASTKIKISFPLVEDKEICLVEVKQGDKPLFTEVTNKYGITSEHFYLRSGNSSPALLPSEQAQYIRTRFNNIL
jgi:uncharacterized protein with ParB-like and HNH nuclease domain